MYVNLSVCWQAPRGSGASIEYEPEDEFKVRVRGPEDE